MSVARPKKKRKKKKSQHCAVWLQTVVRPVDKVQYWGWLRWNPWNINYYYPEEPLWALYIHSGCQLSLIMTTVYSGVRWRYYREKLDIDGACVPLGWRNVKRVRRTEKISVNKQTNLMLCDQPHQNRPAKPISATGSKSLLGKCRCYYLCTWRNTFPSSVCQIVSCDSFKPT